MTEKNRLDEAIHHLQFRLDRALRSEDPNDVKQVASVLVDLAASLEVWCRDTVPDPAHHVLLSIRGDNLYDPHELLKDVRQRAAFQLRIMAEEARAPRGPSDHEDYLERVRSFADDFRLRGREASEGQCEACPTGSLIERGERVRARR